MKNISHEIFDKVYGSFDEFTPTHKDTLLVCIGDSWSRGGSLKFLAPSDDPAEIDRFRKQNCFGNFLRKRLDCDWCNVALQGMSNAWIAEQFRRFSQYRSELDYKNVYVVLTLTEVGREIRTDFWPHYAKTLPMMKNLDEFISIMSSQVEDIILGSVRDDIKLIVGRNFVDDSYPGLGDFMLPHSWLDQLDQRSDSDPCYMLGEYVFSYLDKIQHKFTCNRQEWLLDLDRHLDRSIRRIGRLSESKFNIQKQGYQHPTPAGHEIWADYIFKEIVCS
jgi:hypothetical protein